MYGASRPLRNFGHNNCYLQVTVTEQKIVARCATKLKKAFNGTNRKEKTFTLRLRSRKMSFVFVYYRSYWCSFVIVFYNASSEVIDGVSHNGLHLFVYLKNLTVNKG